MQLWIKAAVEAAEVSNAPIGDGDAGAQYGGE